jgi:hypothetical protein
VARKDFSFGYWLNGWRKSPHDTSADILCIESGYFGFMLDMDDLVNARFGLLDDNLDYTQTLEAGAQRLRPLPRAELAIELKVDGKVYRAVTCKAGTDTSVKRLAGARLWESGCWGETMCLDMDMIRSYRAVFDGQTYNCPTISMPVHRVQKDGRCDPDLLLVPPEGVTDFKPGDTVEVDLQWITLPRVADDYYGPNEAFRTHLAANPRSWKTVYREARGNDLDVTVDGGAATHTYPIIIQASQPEITVDIRGGVGAVPIRFDGLKTPSGDILYRDIDGQLVPLDQSVHGNDYWQTGYDAGSNTCRMSFNLPLDGVESSKWVLKQTYHAD